MHNVENKLTLEMIAAAYKWAAKYQLKQVCTDPVNIESLTENISELYTLCDMKPPLVLLVKSPLEIAYVISNWDEYIEPLLEQNLGRKLEFYKGTFIALDFNDHQFAKAPDFEETMRGSFEGQFFLRWQAYESFYREVCGFKHDMEREAKAFANVQENVNWWYAGSNVCICSERPSVILYDDFYRLHSLDSPAVKFKDGFSLYYINGVQVTRQVVMEPETLSASQILNESDKTLKKIMLEQVLRKSELISQESC